MSVKTDKEIVQQAMEEFDKLDELGKWAVAKVFRETPEVGQDSPIHEALKKRGYVPEDEAN